MLEAGADMPTALLTLTSGVLKQKPKLEKAPLLGELLDLYMKSIPELAIETSTWKMLHTHMAHLKRLLGVLTRPSSFSLEHLQAYVNSRSQDKGLRGKPLSPTTIKKELAMLTTVRSWGIESGLVSQSLPRKSGSATARWMRSRHSRLGSRLSDLSNVVGSPKMKLKSTGIAST